MVQPGQAADSMRPYSHIKEKWLNGAFTVCVLAINKNFYTVGANNKACRILGRKVRVWTRSLKIP